MNERLAVASSRGNGNGMLSLADARPLVAHAHGFENWGDLESDIE